MFYRTLGCLDIQMKGIYHKRSYIYHVKYSISMLSHFSLPFMQHLIVFAVKSAGIINEFFFSEQSLRVSIG